MTPNANPTRIDIDDLPSLVGRDLGKTAPMRIDQQRIDRFADATDDHQWIHLDPERAANGPFGTTIAHGFLTLSLIVPLVAQLIAVDGVAQVINYGLNRVRFPAVVPVDSEIELALRVSSVEAVSGGYQVIFEGAIGAPDAERPSCVVEQVLRYYGGKQ